MHLRLNCVFLIFAVSTCGARNVGIIGGEPADIRDFPYMVKLISEPNFMCGGSIIDEYTILTAAHCLNDVPITYIKYGNSHVKEGHLIEISKTFIHKKADGISPFYYDIGLLKLKSPIQFSETAQPIKLAQAGEDTPAHKSAVLTGWGVSNFSETAQPIKLAQAEEDTPAHKPADLTGWGESNVIQTTYPDVLQKVNMTVYSDKECVKSNKDVFKRPINPQIQICSSSRINGKGVCWGDSGGALVVDGVQYGIVTGGADCASNIYPAIFVKVSAFIDWIREHK